MAKRLALLIGNDEYVDARLGTLTVPQADVEALRAVLADPAVGGFDDVVPLLNPSLAEAQEHINELLSGRHRDDLVLLYFSGHGVVGSRSGKLYLALKRTRVDKLGGTALRASFVKEELDDSAARRQVLILDCCHSGAFGRGAKDAQGRPAVTEETFAEHGYGRAVLTSSSAVQRSWEGQTAIGDTDRSVFTHFLVEGMETGEAAGGDEVVTVEQLYHYAHDRTVASGASQTPQRWVDRQEGSIAIARNPRPALRPAPLPGGLEAALADPDRYKREGAVRELARLARGGDPALALSARQALEARVRVEENRFVYGALEEALKSVPADTSTEGQHPDAGSSSPGAGPAEPPPRESAQVPRPVPEPSGHRPPSPAAEADSPASPPQPTIEEPPNAPTPPRGRTAPTVGTGASPPATPPAGRFRAVPWGLAVAGLSLLLVVAYLLVAPHDPGDVAPVDVGTNALDKEQRMNLYLRTRLANSELTSGDPQRALEEFEQILELDPNDAAARAGLERAQAKLEAVAREREVAELYREAEAALAGQDWERAQGLLERVLALDPEHAAARAGLKRVQAQVHLAGSEVANARARVDEACAQADMAEREAQRAQQLLTAGVVSESMADRATTDAKALAAACQAAHAALEVDARPGTVFRDPLKDGGRGPEMAVVPAGEFVMGSPEDEEGRQADEGPQRTVRIARPFAIGRFEVTFEEYDAFARATDRRLPDDRGWGRGTRPVINVSWEDASAYAEWMTKQTGRRYRLPSEAEWEYAARAGTETAYWWGPRVGRGNANCEGCGSEWDGRQTAPVGSFAANAWGIHDSAGNVWEWGQDCWHMSYVSAPAAGGARDGRDCAGRVLRGGSYYSDTAGVRSGSRVGGLLSADGYGFRLVQDL